MAVYGNTAIYGNYEIDIQNYINMSHYYMSYFVIKYAFFSRILLISVRF